MAETREQIGKKIKAAIVEILSECNIDPVTSRGAVLRMLPDIWRRLESRQLIRKGMTYQGFREVASRQATWARLQDAESFGDVWAAVTEDF